MPTTIAVPRLSVDYAGTSPHGCGRCGKPVPPTADYATCERTVWREHDDRDHPEMIFVVLCRDCARKVIEPHARLYAELGRNEPAPGVMAICCGCVHQADNRCRSPLARANGGDGLAFAAADVTAHLSCQDKKGRRYGRMHREWQAEPAECPGFEAKSCP